MSNIGFIIFARRFPHFQAVLHVFRRARAADGGGVIASVAVARVAFGAALRWHTSN